MKLGGHETFYPRPGWLAKGLLHLCDGGAGSFSAPQTADSLGVGRNMAKSIGWWLQTTGLAERAGKSALEASDFGRIVAERDPFMTRLGTWWLIHATAQTVQTGTSLTWFWSSRRYERFDRSVLVEALSQEVASRNGKPAALKSVQREVAAILQTYAVPVPRSHDDPEDNLGSPFFRLGLFRHTRATDRFECGEATPAPPEALGLLLTAFIMGRPAEGLKEGVTLSASATGPDVTRAGAVLGRSREELLSLASSGAATSGQKWIGVSFLAGERVITIKSASAATWASFYYDRMAFAAQERAA